MSTTIKAIAAMVTGVYSFCVQVVLYVVGVCTSLVTILVAVYHLIGRAYVYAMEWVHPAAETVKTTTVTSAHTIKDGADGTASALAGAAANVVGMINSLLPVEEED